MEKSSQQIRLESAREEVNRAGIAARQEGWVGSITSREVRAQEELYAAQRSVDWGDISKHPSGASEYIR
jgi:hypothetical protein